MDNQQNILVQEHNVAIDQSIREYLIAEQFNAAVRAGAEIIKIYKHSDDYDISLKSDRTPITIADRLAHKAIKASLGKTRIPILSEEGREMAYEERKNWDLFWLVDPLDGTVEFIKENNEFTVNIALMQNNICISAIIYVPYYGKIYVAEQGQGAWLVNDIAPSQSANYTYSDIVARRLALPLAEQKHDDFIVAVSRSHQTPETHEHIDSLRTQHPNLKVVEQGSSYKFCMLAEGAVDYYIRTTTTSEWDTAAGELILKEAGGITTIYPTNKELAYNKESLDNPWFIAKRL